MLFEALSLKDKQVQAAEAACQQAALETDQVKRDAAARERELEAARQKELHGAWAAKLAADKAAGDHQMDAREAREAAEAACEAAARLQ